MSSRSGVCCPLLRPPPQSPWCSNVDRSHGRFGDRRPAAHARPCNASSGTAAPLWAWSSWNHSPNRSCPHRGSEAPVLVAGWDRRARFGPPCPADLSGDGIVEAWDLALVLGAWNPCPSPCTPGDPDQTCPADLSGDCIVEAWDLALLLGSWGPCCGDGLCRPEEQCGLEDECEPDCGPCP